MNRSCSNSSLGVSSFDELMNGRGLSSIGLFRPAPGGRSGLARERDLQAAGGGLGPAEERRSRLHRTPAAIPYMEAGPSSSPAPPRTSFRSQTPQHPTPPLHARHVSSFTTQLDNLNSAPCSVRVLDVNFYFQPRKLISIRVFRVVPIAPTWLRFTSHAACKP